MPLPRRSLLATASFAALDPVQKARLEAELAADVDTSTMFLTHVPMPVEFFAPDKDGVWILRAHHVHRDEHALARLFARFSSAQLCVAGHTHLGQRIDLWGTAYLVSPPVSGAWLRGDFQGFWEVDFAWMGV